MNILLLEAIKQILKFAKFLKELYTNKGRLKRNERVNLSQNVSTLIQHMPKKCKDLGMFTIPCIICNYKFDDTILDLGASINVMPVSIYNSLGIGPLCATGVVIQLTNRSNTYLAWLIEDVLARVNELTFFADYYILEMEEESPSSKLPIILGSHFLKIARTKLDVHAGTLSMEFRDNIVHFNIFDAMKHPVEEHLVLRIDVMSDLVDDVYDDLKAAYPKIACLDDSFDCLYDSNDDKLCSVCIELPCFFKEL